MMTLRCRLICAWLLAVLSFAACQPDRPQADPIRPAEDNCASCRMQVSRAKFAAEILTPDGTYLKFDDIGCFRDYLKEHAELAQAPRWVMDYSTGTTWIDADGAAYAIGAKEATPMGSAIVALPARSDAEKYGARVLDYNEMMAGK